MQNLDDVWIWVHQPEADAAGLVALPPFFHCIQRCGVHMTGTSNIQQNLVQWLLSKQGFSLHALVGGEQHAPVGVSNKHWGVNNMHWWG